MSVNKIVVTAVLYCCSLSSTFAWALSSRSMLLSGWSIPLENFGGLYQRLVAGSCCCVLLGFRGNLKLDESCISDPKSEISDWTGPDRQ